MQYIHKAFKTWYYMRTVLIGDACHKMVPFAGVGAVNAIMDCIVLVNCLYDMPDGDTFTNADITAAFQSYYAQRADAAIAAVKGSNKVSTMVGSNRTLSLMICKASIAGMSETLISLAADRIFASRPILTFLPFVPDYGERKSNPQPLGRRDREELEALREKERVDRMETARVKKEERKLKKAKFKPGSSLFRIVGANASSSNNSSKTGSSGGSRILMASSAASPYMSTPSTVATTMSSASIYASHHHSRSNQQQQLPRHNGFDGTTPVGINSPPGPFSIPPTSSFIGPPSTERPFSPDSSISSDGDFDDDDADSMFSFSSRYTLPYDLEVLSSQYYTGRRAIYPYLDPSAQHQQHHDNPSPSAASLSTSVARNNSNAVTPLTTEAIASLSRRDSSSSILSTLWKRYGRRRSSSNSRPLSTVSIQSSTISGIGFRGFTGASGGASGADDDDSSNQQAQNMYDDIDDYDDEQVRVGVVVGQNPSAVGLDVYDGGGTGSSVEFNVPPPASQLSPLVSSRNASAAIAALSQDDVCLSSLSLPSSTSSSSFTSSSPPCCPVSTSSTFLPPPSEAAFVREGEKEEMIRVGHKEQEEHAGRATSHYFGDDFRADLTRKATSTTLKPASPSPSAAPAADGGIRTSTVTVTFTSTKPLLLLSKTKMTASPYPSSPLLPLRKVMTTAATAAPI
jgi:hypothetical protein